MATKSKKGKKPKGVTAKSPLGEGGESPAFMKAEMKAMATKSKGKRKKK